MQHRTITTDVLDIAYLDYGAPDGWPCIMGHGFPYDVNAYAETAPILAQAGARVLVPWLRGYGPTRFRSAQDAALRRAGGAWRRSPCSSWMRLEFNARSFWRL